MKKKVAERKLYIIFSDFISHSYTSRDHLLTVARYLSHVALCVFFALINNGKSSNRFSSAIASSVACKVNKGEQLSIEQVDDGKYEEKITKKKQ